jgi:hypothetical protein
MLQGTAAGQMASLFEMDYVSLFESLFDTYYPGNDSL